MTETTVAATIFDRGNGRYVVNASVSGIRCDAEFVGDRRTLSAVHTTVGSREFLEIRSGHGVLARTTRDER